MRWIYRTLWLLLVVGLFALAALPYTDNLTQTCRDFARAWDIVRHGPPPGESPPPPNTRPQLALPEKETSPPPENPAGTAPPKDPFLAEARARAAVDPEAAMQWLLAEAPPGDRLRGMLEVVA
ncbi:MAG: hypothetical protein ACPGGJ_01375, partial [Coraliomargarita sp.]